MNTEFEILKSLDGDLEDVASRERIRLQRTTLQGSIRRNTGRSWMKVAGAAAAFLVVAGAIGFVAGGGSFVRQLSGADSGDGAGAYGDPQRAVGRDAVPGSGGFLGEAPADQPAASPIPADGSEGAPGFDETEDQAVGVRHSADEFQPRQQQQDLSKIVRDGRIGIVVNDGAFGDAVGELTFIAERHGGFVLSSSTSNERSGTFVLRIPERQFDQARNDIRDLATRVRFEEVRGDDVTAEFIDFQARLRILQTRRELLFDLFQQADTTDEILRMSSQLDEVTLRIEEIQGQLRFLKDQVAESTLRVSIQERNAPAVTGEPDVDNPDLGSSIDLGVQGFLRIVGAVIVGLGYLIPITALAVGVWMAVWFVRRRRAIS
jgi:vacuolar-type H+-ATPase subunit E/Vma4